MPSNILKLMPPGPNYGSVHLGTVRNDGAKAFTDSLMILQAGMPPLLNLSLPDAMPAMEELWATITMTVIGCKISPNGMLPVPLTGMPMVWPPPPPPAPPLPPPVPPFAVGVPGWLAFPPFTTGTPPVTVVAPVRNVGLPIAGTPDLVIPGGVIDCMAMPGAMYELQFSVTPLLTASLGIKRYEFPLLAAGVQVATIGIGAHLISPDHPDSE